MHFPNCRFEITDQNNDTASIIVGPIDDGWKPEVPGKVKGETSKGNPWDMIRGTSEDTDDLMCYWQDSLGQRTLVLRLEGASWRLLPIFMPQGGGYLYELGTQTLHSGVITWKKL